MLKRIIIYVSDHGHGHAARTIALVRNLLNTGRFEIIIKNSNAFDFLRSSLPNVQIDSVKTDVGPVFDWDSYKVDIDKTVDDFSNWIKNEEMWISREADSFNENAADLIITDISPMAIRLAQKVKCSCVTVGNFSWLDILKEIPFQNDRDRILSWLNESFAMSEFAIKLPLSMNMDGFTKTKNASLLCREPTCTRTQTFKEFELDSPPAVFYVGRKIPASWRITRKDITTPIAIIGSNEFQVENRRISGYNEGQNLIAASQVVIAKLGYSTLSECVKFRIPMYVIPRLDYPEDVVMLRWVKDLGIGMEVNMNESQFGIEIPDSGQIEKMKSSINEKLITSLEKRPDAASIIQEMF